MLTIKQLFIFGTLLCGMIMGLQLQANGQCIDTNTLLDSIYSVNLKTLTALGEQKDFDEVSAALDSTIRLNHINKGDVYQPIILNKIFKNKSNNNTKSDSLFNKITSNYDNEFVTKIRHLGTPNYHVVLLTDKYRSMYLATLNKDLSLIDFIQFHHINNITMIRVQKKPLIYNVKKSGTKGSCNDYGTIRQEVWTETTRDGEVIKEESSEQVQRFTIDNNGTIKPFQE